MNTYSYLEANKSIRYFIKLSVEYCHIIKKNNATQEIFLI